MLADEWLPVFTAVSAVSWSVQLIKLCGKRVKPGDTTTGSGVASCGGGGGVGGVTAATLTETFVLSAPAELR